MPGASAQVPVGPAVTTLVTQASPSVPVGGQISDTATLAGGSSPGGTITFALYGPDDPTCLGTPLFSSNVAVVGNRQYTSEAYTPSYRGTYRWVASYGGDVANLPAQGACDAPGESVVVTRAVTTLVTSASGTVPVGGQVSDTATLSGGFEPFGILSFHLYGPDDPTCTGVPAFSSYHTVNGTGTYTSAFYSPGVPGIYRWVASYGGDPANTPAEAACNDPGESVVVSPAPPTTTTSTTTIVPPTTTTTTTVPPTSTPTTTTVPPTSTPTTTTVPPTSTPVPPTSTTTTTTVPSTTTTGPPTSTGTSSTTTTVLPTTITTAPAAPTPPTPPPVTTLPPTTSAAPPGPTPTTAPPPGTTPASAAPPGTPAPPPPASPTPPASPPELDPGIVEAASGPIAPVAEANLHRYDPADHPADIVTMQVAAFALLALLGVGRRRRSIASAAIGAGSTANQAGEVVSTEVESADEGLAGGFLAAVRRGDRSRTWRWPGTAHVDRLSLAVPPRVSSRSPLLARVLDDAGYLRAMLGSLYLAVPAFGAFLAALAVASVDGRALPPAIGLAAGLAVLGVFDALAGVIAVVVFAGGVVLLGGVTSADNARTMLGLATLWFAAPLIAGTARPLRRPPTMTRQEHWDRTADIVIASLVGAWAVQVILQGLPGLAGIDLPIADSANRIALMVLAALAVRMLLETIAAHSYPLRLAQVQPPDMRQPSTAQRLAAHALVLTIFVFVAISYLGSCWQLYVGGALFILPKVLDLFADRLPNSARVHAVTPRGIVAIVLMLFVGAVVGALVLRYFSTGQEAIRDSFVLLSLPGLALALLELFGREGPDRELPFRHQLLGIPVLGLGVLLALGVITI